jgi:ABC-type transport system involved in cytochrome bd biosynthesis fused ATPase/permease subunit
LENSNKSWADLVHENKKTIKILLFSILGILLLIIVSTLLLVTSGYDVSTAGITKQKVRQDSLIIKK